MGKRPGLLYEALQRLDGLMAIGQSRADAKAQARAQGEHFWSFSDGKMHSYQTRATYQDMVMRFLRWCRTTHGTKRLAEVDQRADELASAYVLLRVQEGYSPWTLATERSALRLFFGSPLLAEQVPLPPRHREAIHRSRQTPGSEEQSSPHFQPEHWQPLLAFLRVTGLRRREVRMLRVAQIQEQPDGGVVLHVQGKGGKVRQVPVLAGQEATVLSLVQGRGEDELVFAHIPSHLDIHAYRRHYAQTLYQELSGLPLPPAAGRLPRGILDEQAILAVSRALGHNRRDVVLTYYLR
ncbi:hypothetical protein KSD_42530 [Ktedonobacter sp. SOSP1-85]|uniref:site-specific integrase n=1 Tax=Ktedonobacter sp. SOSP1-85 TaxID=2778367 RepID=UPI00191658AA|nr:site-specific integrase [Ktedonobacter sp. SOSP1-85]GHO76482.1 hypothetical protein KSD_42530 [Ktedonobacter sp. SOSP1-85]